MNQQRPEENWRVFFTYIDDQPASITVDLALRSIVPMASYPRLIVTEVTLKHPCDNDFPTPGEGEPKRSPVEDAILGVVQNEATNAFQVGKIIGHGMVRCFFYGPQSGELLGHGENEKNRSLLEGRLDQAMKAFPDCECRSFERHDVDWATYLDHLYPSPRELQMIKTRRMLDELKSQGDQSHRLREIEHFIVCPDTAIQTRIVALAASTGFRCATRRDYGVILHKHGAPDDIGDIVRPLFELAEQEGASYDGWSARAVKKQRSI